MVLEIEKQILGKLLIDSSVYFNHKERFGNPELIFSGINLEIYNLLVPQFYAGKIDLIAISKQITYFKGNTGAFLKYINELKQHVNFKEAIDSQITYVVETNTNAKLSNDLSKAQLMLGEGKSVEEIHLFIKQLFESLTTSSTTVIEPIFSQFKELNNIIWRNSSGKVIEGFKTGFFELDQHSNGFQRTDLNLIVARTSVGKTSFAIQTANNIALNNIPVAILSLEMSPVQLAARFASINSDISSKRILYEQMTENEIKQYNERITEISKANVFLHDTRSNDIFYILDQIRKLHYEKKVCVFYVDYIQLIGVKGSKEGRTNDTGRVARELKNIAKELDVCINSLCQVKRNDDNPTKPPTIFDLRASGELEEAADNIIILHRPEAHMMNRTPDEWKGVADIEWAKGRNLGLGGWQFGFDGKCTRFFSKQNDYKKIVSFKNGEFEY